MNKLPPQPRPYPSSKMGSSKMGKWPIISNTIIFVINKLLIQNALVSLQVIVIANFCVQYYVNLSELVNSSPPPPPHKIIREP